VDVSVIIISWNTRELLAACLLSVYEQNRGALLEVIVVDNASVDGSAAMVRELFPEVILVANTYNRGFAAANNQGLRLAGGRYVLLLNPDTVILDDAIGRAAKLMPPDTAALGVRVLNADGSLQPTCFMCPSPLNLMLSCTYLYKLFPRSRFFGRERMGWWRRDDARQVEVVTGCFLMVRRSAIDCVGLLDERFFVYGEETDWCYRFRKAGWKVAFTPAASIIHYGGASTAQTASAMSLQRRGSILLFIKKHYNRLAYWFCCFLTLVFFLVRIPYWLACTFVSFRNPGYSSDVLRTYIVGAVRCLGGAEKLCTGVER
jgi:GT2 family glycosyltransferase